MLSLRYFYNWIYDLSTALDTACVLILGAEPSQSRVSRKAFCMSKDYTDTGCRGMPPSSHHAQCLENKSQKNPASFDLRQELLCYVTWVLECEKICVK